MNARYQSLVTRIPEDRALAVESTIDIPDVGRAQEVTVTPIVDHARDSDLRLWLKPPGRDKILVRDRKRGTIPAAPLRVPSAEGVNITGRWTLLVEDLKRLHGGSIKWELGVTTLPAASFALRLVFDGGLTDDHKDAFKRARDRILSFVTGVESSDPLVMVVRVAGIRIDEEGGIIGQAGPTRVRRLDLLPFEGIAQFDNADLDGMLRDGTIDNVATHELGHDLGYGTHLWQTKGLIRDNRFAGFMAMRSYGRLLGGKPQPVPLEDNGGSGTAGGHLEKDVFGPELWTGWISPGQSPISEVSISMFADKGYRVDFSKADPFVLGLRASKLGRTPRRQKCLTAPEFTIE